MATTLTQLPKETGSHVGQRMRWLDGITDSMDVSLGELRVDDEQHLACVVPKGNLASGAILDRELIYGVIHFCFSFGFQILYQIAGVVCLDDGEALLDKPAPAFVGRFEDGYAVVVPRRVVGPCRGDESTRARRKNLRQLRVCLGIVTFCHKGGWH